MVLVGCAADPQQPPSALSTTSAPATPTPSSSPAAAPAPASSPLAVTAPAARAKLAALRTVTRDRRTAPYSRSAFGSSWADLDGNGCNQRDDVLLRDSVPGTVVVGRQGRCAHDVLAGQWRDPYTGRLLTFDDLKELAQAQAIQIDHVVPLAEAWRSGADRWRAQRRERYANDPRGLLAVDGPANMSKGDGDPAAWRPSKGYQCAYAKRWINTKARWDLGVDPSERRALEEMLAYCR